MNVNRNITQVLLSRRRFIATAAAATFTPRSLFAQQPDAQPEIVIQARKDAASAKITTEHLRGKVSVLLGSGGNIAVLPGPQGKLLVDSGISTSRAQITEALAGISADPIQQLVNTHWHYDHTDGNEWMHSAGATIIASEKTRTRLSSPQIIAIFNTTFPAAPAGALPTQTFTAPNTLKTNGATLILTRYDPAHTDTDISVHFADADILHCGDTWFNGAYPFMDYSTGGHIDGMIRAAKLNLATGTQNTILIPGHGPIGNKKELTADLEMWTSSRDSIASLKKQGKSIEEVLAAKPTAKYDAKYGNGFVTPELFTRLVYQGV